MNLSRPLAETLEAIAPLAADSAEQWWIIGSAAVALHGASISHDTDVDLLMTADDADALLRRVGEVPRKGCPDDRFRSRIFGTWTKLPLPVEVMGGLEVATPAGWHEVTISTRHSVCVRGVSVFVPGREELVRLLHLFGRPKDLERAMLLQG